MELTICWFNDKLNDYFLRKISVLRDVEQIHEFALHHEPVNGQFRKLKFLVL